MSSKHLVYLFASTTLVSLLVLGCEAPLDDAALPAADDVEGHHHEIAEQSVGAHEIAREWAEVDGYRVSPVLEAEAGATRVGALVTLVTAGVQAPVFEARGIDAEGHRGPWQALETSWAEQDLFVADVDLDFLAHGAELRIPAESFGAVLGLTWSALVPLGSAPAEDELELPLPVEGDVGRATHALRTEFANAGVIPRSSWGARATRCTSRDANKHRIAIHHTVTPATTDPGVRLRGIQHYHMDTQGWCDIGYHLLITLDGRVWEGRSAELLGTHVLNQNGGNFGISYVGCFHTSGCNDWTPFTPPEVMIESGANMVRLAAQIYGISINSSTVKGHRDHAGQSTTCPGNNLHSQLGRIRSLASAPATPPELRAEYVHQSFPLASQPFELRPGERASGYLEMRNTGTATWAPGTTFLATTEPRDGASSLAGSDWVSPSRAATIDSTVAPNETGRFNFTVEAPLTPGEYPQFFNLVHDGIGWFGDSDQGGPPDAHIQLRVTVLDEPPVTYDGGTPPGSDAGPGHADDAGVAPMPGVDAGVEPGDGTGRPSASGCSASAGSTGGSAGVLFAVAALALLRRRARRS